MKPNSAMLIFATDFSFQSQGVRVIEDGSPQESDFFYLSGFSNKSSCILLLKREAKKDERQIIFCPEPSEQATLWLGEAKSPTATASSLSFDEGLPITKLKEFLSERLVGIENIYYPVGKSPGIDENIASLMRHLASYGQRRSVVTPVQIINSSEILGTLRLIKSKEEMNFITMAAEISVGGHKRIMKGLIADEFRYEYQAEAELGYHYRRRNAIHAFPPIVAGGESSCVLHYTNNNKELKPTDSLLVDSGAMYNHYAADITRSYPPRIGSKRAAYMMTYNAVLTVHKRLCSGVNEGMTLDDLYAKAARLLTKELLKMNILQGNEREIIKQGLYKKYFPHKTSHWIGLDVHDAGTYAGQKLRPGMVFSIEPGLYFPKKDRSISSAWRGIGIRIEDTVALTNDGAINLTQDMPYWEGD